MLKNLVSQRVQACVSKRESGKKHVVGNKNVVFVIVGVEIFSIQRNVARICGLRKSDVKLKFGIEKRGRKKIVTEAHMKSSSKLGCYKMNDF